MHGSALHASFDGTADAVTLTGQAVVEDAGRSVRAGTILFHRLSGDAEADGGVSATLAANDPNAPASHVSAQRARFAKAAGAAQFLGGDAGTARLFQGASQVDAAVIDLDNKRGVLIAHALGADGMVESVFAAAKSDAKPGSLTTPSHGAPTGTLRVRSRRLQFSNAEHRAVFAGPVEIEGLSGKVSGDEATAFFAAKTATGVGGPAPTATVDLQTSALDRVVVNGNVRLTQSGREGVGTELVYRAADGSFLITGTAAAPPHVHDTAQGDVTGSSLLMRPGDSTIIVSGAGPAAAGGASTTTRGRARIETRLRQKAP